MKTLSPIVLFVYARPQHTQIVLESLAKCPEAARSQLYIFSDAAKNEKALAKVQAVRRIIHNNKWIDAFDEVIIKESDNNKGLAKSVIDGVTYVIQKHGTVIVVEDDNRVAPDFLDYMNRGLDYFKENHKIGNIGGYRIPITLPSHYPHDIYMAGRGSSYAWATWLDRWELVDWDVNDFPEFKKNRRARKAFNEYGEDRYYLLRQQVEGSMDSWAIRFSYSCWKNGMYSILPCKTRVENIGFDGSGVHNVEGENTFKTKIEGNLKPVKFEIVEENEQIKKEYQRIFRIPRYLKVKRSIKRLKAIFS